MATTSKKAARPNPHTAVSNQPHETESAIKKAVTVPPAEGTNPKTAKPGPGGAEAVPGFKLAREAASLEEVSKAPETTSLRDIAEASFGPPPPQEETVHGFDDRVRITTTTIYPWRAHASRSSWTPKAGRSSASTSPVPMAAASSAPSSR